MKTASIPGINIQWPWSELIISGQKTIETRGYDIPRKHVGAELAVIETPGPKGKKSAGISKARIVGIVVFEKTYQYKNRSHWMREAKLHLVDSSDPQYSYKEAVPKWAWVIKKVTRLPVPIAAPRSRGIRFAKACRISATYLAARK